MQDNIKTEEQNHAKDQARLQFESIAEMVKRLEHVENCDGGESCEATGAEIMQGLGYSVSTTDPNGPTPTDKEREEYHDDDKAREYIQNDALSVEVRNDWHTPGGGEAATPAEYRILLCTGGPAVQITGELEQGQPSTVALQYQDWFTPWTEYPLTGEQQDILMKYVECFYWGDF